MLNRFRLRETNLNDVPKLIPLKVYLIAAVLLVATTVGYLMTQHIKTIGQQELQIEQLEESLQTRKRLMLRSGMLLLLVMSLSGCWTTFSLPVSSPVCEGLENPLVDHTKALVGTQKETPELVLRTGATLVQAYRAACKL
jgi:hypothetical protein